MYIEYWILLGVIISIATSIFDLPLRLDKVIFTTIWGILGSLVGSAIAYLVVNTHLMSIPLSTITLISCTIFFIILQRKQLERFTALVKGGEKYVRWNVLR